MRRQADQQVGTARQGLGKRCLNQRNFRASYEPASAERGRSGRCASSIRTGEQAWQGQASLPTAPLTNPISAKSQRAAALLAGSVVIFLCARTQALELRKFEHRSGSQPCDTQTLFRGMKTHRCAEQRTESFGQCYRTAAAPKTRELEALLQFTASNELRQPKTVRAHNLFDLAVRI